MRNSRKSGFFDKSFKEIFLSEIVSVIGGLIAGTLLALYTDKVLIIPGMLIVLPWFLEMRGNISGSFASRLTSGLFLKIIDSKKYNSKIVRENILASFIQAIIVSFLLGIILFLFHLIFIKSLQISLIFIPLFAALIANFVEIALTLTATFTLFRNGHDPNNIIGPFVTTTGDITSILSLLLVFYIIL